jgi:hypothetical protein
MPNRDDNNLINFIAITVETILDRTANMGEQIAIMADQMATKSDVARLESSIEAKTTVIRGDIEHVHLRLDSIDRALSSRMS